MQPSVDSAGLRNGRIAPLTLAQRSRVAVRHRGDGSQPECGLFLDVQQGKLWLACAHDILRDLPAVDAGSCALSVTAKPPAIRTLIDRRT